MSTEEEIWEVYSGDIEKQANIVKSRFGLEPFFENFEGFHTDYLLSLPPEDGELLEEILRRDRLYKDGGDPDNQGG